MSINDVQLHSLHISLTTEAKQDTYIINHVILIVMVSFRTLRKKMSQSHIILKAAMCS